MTYPDSALSIYGTKVPDHLRESTERAMQGVDHLQDHAEQANQAAALGQIWLGLDDATREAILDWHIFDGVLQIIVRTEGTARADYDLGRAVAMAVGPGWHKANGYEITVSNRWGMTLSEWNPMLGAS